MKLSAILTIAFVALLPTACAVPARSQRMLVAHDALLASKFEAGLQGTISLAEVTGGDKTNPLLISKVSDSELAAAIRSSLENLGLLAPKGQASRFRLQVFLAEVNQPERGLDFTVITVVRYRLLDRTDNAVVLEEVVTANGLATMEDAFVGAARLRIANEASIRQNIATFLVRLAKFRPEVAP